MEMFRQPTHLLLAPIVVSETNNNDMAWSCAV